MGNIRNSLFSTLILLICFSCGSDDKKLEQAKVMLRDAEILEAKEQFKEAIAKVDSAIALAPIDTAILRHSTSLKRHIYLQEANYKLLSIYKDLDSLGKKIPPLVKIFDKIENKYYATELRYQHPDISKMERIEKPFLRLRLDSLGGIHMTSVYVGAKGIKHNRVRLQEIKGSSNYISQIVAYDKALNYRYQAGSKNWELINYGEQDSRAMARFLKNKLCQNPEKTIELQYLNGDELLYKIKLNRSHCEAINKSLELYELLFSRDSLRQEQSKYATRFIRLNQ